MAPTWALCRVLAAALCAVAAAGAATCPPPYDAQPGPYALQVGPGQVLEVAGNLTIAAGERALIEGAARVSGGVVVRGALFLSSAASSTLTADWLVVESGGELWAGSEACPLPPTVTATIELRDGSVHGKAGRKALAVLQGGRLEVRLLAAGFSTTALQHARCPGLAETLCRLKRLPPAPPCPLLTPAAARQQGSGRALDAAGGHRRGGRHHAAARRRSSDVGGGR